MGFNSALRVKIVKNPGNGSLNNLNDPDRPQCVKSTELWSVIRLQRGHVQKFNGSTSPHPPQVHTLTPIMYLYIFLVHSCSDGVHRNYDSTC